VKVYLRTSLYKSFAEKVSYAVSEYFQGNPDFNGDEEEDHVNRILTIRNWTKINPTTSDITLARQLVIDVTIQNLD